MKKGIFWIAAYSLLSMSCSDNGGNHQPAKNDVPKEEHKGGITGSWRLADDQEVSLVIKPDSVYYPDKQLLFSYQLVNKDIIISDSGVPKDTIQYEMRGSDSLVLTIDSFPEVYLRVVK